MLIDNSFTSSQRKTKTTMNQILHIALLAIAAIFSCVSSEVQTVTKLEVPAYLGRWFQVYDNQLVRTFIEKDAFCVTAQYENGANRTIAVTNSQRTGSPTGTRDFIRGVATIPNKCQPGRLSLKLDNVPREGSYWVLALGPKVNGFYQWSIVSDMSGATLFILARDVKKFKSKYETVVLRKATELGFVDVKRPLPSYQGRDCVY